MLTLKPPPLKDSRGCFPPPLKNFQHQSDKLWSSDEGMTVSICVQGRRVDFKWENSVPIVRVYLQERKIVEIRPEYFPRELYRCPSQEALLALVRHSQVYLRDLGNNYIRLELFGRGQGGNHLEEAKVVYEKMVSLLATQVEGEPLNTYEGNGKLLSA